MLTRALGLTLLLAVIGPAIADDISNSDEAGVRHAAAEWIRLYKAADLDGLMQLYTDNPTVALHGKSVLRGRDAVRNFFAPGMGKADVEFIIDIETIEVHGDVAHLISKYWLEARPLDGSQAYTDAGRSLLIYKRGAGNRWLIHADIDQATPDVTWPPP